jgi:hypothetical protein
MLADIIRRMVVFVYHAECLQSFLSAFDWPVVPLMPRFNWFLMTQDTSIDVFPYAML